ncbi:MAG: RNA methyltransferase [Limnobacter sp.]|nr:RNA methyltransferase [Limnobacter sp.]
MRTKTIESAHNDSLKAAKRKVSSTGTLKRNKQAAAEGLHLASWLAHQTELTIEEVWVPQSLLSHAEWPAVQAGLAKMDACTVFHVPDALYKRLSDLQTPTGPLILFNVPQARATINLAEDVVVLDGIQDPGNVGNILRICAAAGIRQVVLSDDSAWGWSEKVLRAGMGAHSKLDLFDDESITQLHKLLHSSPPTPVRATLLNDHSQGLFEVDLKQPGVWVFGSEGQGVRTEWQTLANQSIKIPQTDWVESLNVATSSAICLFEQVRQRLQK